MTRDVRTRPLSTPLKTFAVLEVLASLGTSVSVADLARAMDVTRGYVYQQLVTLQHAGWVEQMDDRSYRLTLRPVQVARAALAQAGVDQRVVPVMERLARQIHEVTSLALLDNDEAVIVQRIEVGQPLRADLAVGTRMPLHHSASGMVLLAFGPPDVIDQLRERGVEVPPDEVLAAARRDGYALSTGKWVDGIRSIAAPVHDDAGRCFAALSVVGPTVRFDPLSVRDEVLSAAAEIDRMLSGSLPTYRTL
jgi:IclR family transcriptional regulator, KDG regulon repressor